MFTGIDNKRSDSIGVCARYGLERSGEANRGAARGGECLAEPIWARRSSKVNEKHSAAEVILKGFGDGDCQSCLAHTTRAKQRDDSPRRHQRTELNNLG